MSIILSLDLGTSKLCAMACDARRGRVLAVKSMPNRADIPPVRDGWHEQAPARIAADAIRLLRAVVAALGPAAQSVRAIALTGQMHGILLADRGFRPLTPLITWRDQRVLAGSGAGSLSRARARLRAVDLAPAGCELQAGYGGATLFWLAAQKRLPRSAVALSIADYVAGILTGVAATGGGMAASWGLWDICRRQWHQPALAGLDIPCACLPTVMPETQPLGGLAGKLAARLGLSANIPVAVPLGDNQASVLGAAGFDRETAVVNLGTGGQISIPIRRFRRVAGLETRPLPDGGFILVGASLCGGLAWAQLCRFMQESAMALADAQVPESEMYRRLNRLAMRAAPGAGGIIAASSFAGARYHPQSKGAINGISCANFNTANLARAVAEGVVGELAALGRAGMHAHIRRMIASGNAARKNTVFCRIIAGKFQRPCSLARHPEEAALGAALFFRKAIGAER